MMSRHLILCLCMTSTVLLLYVRGFCPEDKGYFQPSVPSLFPNTCWKYIAPSTVESEYVTWPESLNLCKVDDDAGIIATPLKSTWQQTYDLIRQTYVSKGANRPQSNITIGIRLRDSNWTTLTPEKICVGPSDPKFATTCIMSAQKWQMNWPSFTSHEYHDMVIKLVDPDIPSLDEATKWTIQTPLDELTPPMPYHILCSVRECTLGDARENLCIEQTTISKIPTTKQSDTTTGITFINSTATPAEISNTTTDSINTTRHQHQTTNNTSAEERETTKLSAVTSTVATSTTTNGISIQTSVYTVAATVGGASRQIDNAPSLTVIIASALTATLFILAVTFTVAIFFVIARNKRRAMQVEAARKSSLESTLTARSGANPTAVPRDSLDFSATSSSGFASYQPDSDVKVISSDEKVAQIY